MTYTEAEKWLNSLIDYEKAADFRYPEVFKLDRVRSMMSALGNPERRFTSIHIAGTKGKGSVSTFVDSLLRAHDCRTGLYTSPHLVSFRERIRVDATNIEETAFADSITKISSFAETWHADHPDERLSFFDVLTATAFDTFASAGVDWGVVEVGMGGRLDATNVVEPRVAHITPIALEHTKYLGDTIELVATEKAGIIKPSQPDQPGTPVLIQRQIPEVESILLNRCAEVGARAFMIDDVVESDFNADLWTFSIQGTGDIRDKVYTDVRLAALGGHQRRNFASAVAMLHLAGIEPDVETVQEVARRTAVPGRLQFVPGSPPILLDVAHTPDSARMLRKTIESRLAGRRTTLIFSSAQDKRVGEIARILAPLAERVVLVPIPGIRAMSIDDMESNWRGIHPFVAQSDSVESAIENARDTTPSHGMIVVCGSFMLVGAAMEKLDISPGG
jgi:dihydrofolate synthase / folylpolyglutamate synthase